MSICHVNVHLPGIKVNNDPLSIWYAKVHLPGIKASSDPLSIWYAKVPDTRVGRRPMVDLSP
jgi:hypothetical protein